MKLNLFKRSITKTDLIKQMTQMRPLPMGRKEFDEWSNRIISGALLHGVSHEDQKYALTDMIMHLGPTEDHKEDAYFIKHLRKVAANQVAATLREEIYMVKHELVKCEVCTTKWKYKLLLECPQCLAAAKAEILAKAKES